VLVVFIFIIFGPVAYGACCAVCVPWLTDIKVFLKKSAVSHLAKKIKFLVEHTDSSQKPAFRL
jgi:DsbC/DsbD-like thiol-disulfide interchange protein